MIAFVRCFALAVMAVLLAAGGAQAQVRISSCYDRVGPAGVEAPPLTGELYVLVDQTLLFSVDFQKHVNAKIQGFLAPGNRVTLISFSALAADRYSEIRLHARMDVPLSTDARYAIPKRDLRKLDTCIDRQRGAARRQTAFALKRIFDGASAELPRTQLLSNLVHLTERVIPRTRTTDQVSVLVVSDMMENSEALTFYRRGTLGAINPAEALKQVQDAGLTAKFDGLELYVVGALYGLADEYVPASRIDGLRDFWRSYVQGAGGALIEFGTPYLSGRLAH